MCNYSTFEDEFYHSRQQYQQKSKYIVKKDFKEPLASIKLQTTTYYNLNNRIAPLFSILPYSKHEKSKPKLANFRGADERT